MYLILKALHLFAVAIFLGNIITGLFWKAGADRTGDARARAQALDGIIASDRWFTVPGVVLVIATGVAMSLLAGLPILRTRWIAVSLLLFVLSGVIFASALAPWQRRLHAMARTAADGGHWDAAGYRHLSLRWEVWGLIAIALPLGALVLMVMRPALD